MNRRWWSPLIGPVAVMLFTLVIAKPHKSFYWAFGIFIPAFTLLLWKTRTRR